MDRHAWTQTTNQMEWQCVSMVSGGGRVDIITNDNPAQW